MLNYYPPSRLPNFTPFCSKVARSPDEVFDFSIGYNGELKISKIPNKTYFCEDHWEENSGQVSKCLGAICRSSVLKFSLP